jgi:formylglycine-generating enzyme required for sulfatase activity
MKKIYSSLLICAIWLMLLAMVNAQTMRGVGIKVKTGSGETKEISLYDGSYALVIGNSQYSNGWDNLIGVRSDVVAVSKVLSEQGFQVETAENLTRSQFTQRVDKFIDDYGFKPNNRLLIYYAGHGHTLKSGGDNREFGYVVPVDAPNPKNDEVGFKQKAIRMDVIQSFAKRIESKHALFLFDSCFSGKLVTRNAIRIPPIIEEKVSLPVRQFITAGAANQPVPDESVFRRSFVYGLSQGEADLNNDGYITGTELAEYLKEKVTNYSNRTQTPQYGKINDFNLDKGDFVFLVGKAANPLPPVANSTNKKEESNTGELGAWELLKDSSNVSDFELFLKAFPSGTYAPAARLKLNKLVKDIWEKLKDSDDSAKVQAFLNKYPDSEQASLAKNLLEELAKIVKPGTVRKNSIGMQLVYLPPGEFMMGSSEADIDKGRALSKVYWGKTVVWFKRSEKAMKHETPQRKVTIKDGFWMGAFEVTQAQWQSLMGSVPADCYSGFDLSGGNKPVVCVSWDDAKTFIQRLNARNDGFTYSLPSEAEWEYAARAGTSTSFYWGDDISSNLICDYANVRDRSAFEKYPKLRSSPCNDNYSEAAPVGSKKPNSFGLYDMSGNVWEWVEDIYSKSYSGLPADGSANVTEGDQKKRVIRGGSWTNHGSLLRSAERLDSKSSLGSNAKGFRIVARQSN